MRAALHAELCKLVTLPAIWWTATLTTAVTVLLIVRDVDPVGYAQVGFLVLGALATTSDTGGPGATSLLSVPRRWRLLAAKLLAVALVAVPIAGIGLVGRTGTRAAAYLVLTALLAAAVGTLLRAGTPAVAVLLGHYVVAGPVLRADWLPGPQADAVTVVLWTAGAIVAAACTVRLRDA
jgi:ABC-2 type transport system permease protein